MKTYTIKPLEWEDISEEDIPCFVAKTPWGNYSVMDYTDDEWTNMRELESFCEYGFMSNEDNFDPDWEETCSSVEEGKKLCEKDYLDKMEKCLKLAIDWTK